MRRGKGRGEDDDGRGEEELARRQYAKKMCR